MERCSRCNQMVPKYFILDLICKDDETDVCFNCLEEQDQSFSAPYAWKRFRTHQALIQVKLSALRSRLEEAERFALAVIGCPNCPECHVRAAAFLNHAPKEKSCQNPT